MAVFRTYRVSAFHYRELDSHVAYSDEERDQMVATFRAVYPHASVVALEVCGICGRPDRVLRDDWASAPDQHGVLHTARVCDDCYGYDEESALALIDAEGYHALSQIDFIEFTLGTGGL
jgi:hypothetical protein